MRIGILLIHRKESHVQSCLPPNLTEFSTVYENKRRGESHPPFVQNIFTVEHQIMKDLEEWPNISHTSEKKREEGIGQKSFNLHLFKSKYFI